MDMGTCPKVMAVILTIPFHFNIPSTIKFLSQPNLIVPPADFLDYRFDVIHTIC